MFDKIRAKRAKENREAAGLSKIEMAKVAEIPVDKLEAYETESCPKEHLSLTERIKKMFGG